MIDITTFDDNTLDNFIKAATAEKERRAQSARKEAISELIEAAKKVYEIDHLYSVSFETDEGYLDIYMDDLLIALRESCNLCGVLEDSPQKSYPNSPPPLFLC